MQIQRVKYKDIERVPQLQIAKTFKQEFAGSAPAPFIGRMGYPKVNIGFLSPQFSGDTSHYDAPTLWSRGKFSIGQVATMRYGLVNARTQWNITDAYAGERSRGYSGGNKATRQLDIIQEVGMASTPVELEVALTKIPQLHLTQETLITPFGPRSEVKKVRVTANTKVDNRVEKVVADTDLKAVEGVKGLYKKGIEENQLTKLISVGTLGLGKNRKLVPTRWSITAVDDMLGKERIEEIKQYQEGEYQVYFGGHFGNYYLILFFPEKWSYELFETYLETPVNPWSKRGYAYSTDYEDYSGRKMYAEETAGGYYACRFPIVEKLGEMKRQASVLALRFISSEYTIPLGVWVCREATRKALAEKPVVFGSEELMMEYVRELIRRKFGFELDFLLRQSKLRRNKKEQKKLREFM